MPSLQDGLQDDVPPRFRIERELGRGGMGVVFLARDLRLDRPVAIKVLKPEQASARAAERFLREARTLARVRHPNIVPIYEPGDERKALSYYVMEYIEGATLAERLRQGRLEHAEVVRIGLDLLGGLGAAHRHGVVHRDVKPSNVFVLADRAVLGDFGIAHSPAESDETLTDPDKLIGTLRYMAPEQFQPGGRVDQRTDLYSAGVLLYEALTGDIPRLPGSGAPIRWSPVPRRLRGLLGRALEVRPEDRWQDADRFRRALLRASQTDARVNWIAAGLAVACVFILLTLWRPRPAPPPSPADLAVLPFQSADSGHLGRELARYTADRLRWFPGWSLQPTAQTFRWADSVPASAWQERAGPELTVASFATGRVFDGPAGPVLELVLRDSSGRALTIGPLRVPGTPDELPEWSRVVADSVAARIAPNLAANFMALNQRSGDPQAYREYFLADSAVQRDAYEDADHHYSEALRRDPRFVEAALQRAIVRRLRRVPFEADLKQLYEQSGNELPEQHRSLIAALLEPDPRARFALYRRTVEAFPRDATVRFIYSDELFHRGPLVGIPLDSALAELTRLLDLHPDLEQASTYDHLMWGYLRLGREPAANASLTGRMRIPFSGEREEARKRKFLQLAYESRYSPFVAGAKLRWIALTADSAVLEGIRRYVRLGNLFDIPEAQLALGRVLTRRGISTLDRASGHRAQGLALMLLGRPGEALPHLDSAVSIIARPDSAIEPAEWRVLPPLLGLPLDTAVRAGGLARLEELARAGAHPRVAWALALASSGSGSAPDAQWTARVRAAVPGSRAAARLVTLLDGVTAAAQGRPDSALALTAPLLAYDSAGVVEDPFARAVLHTRRADWLLALGDTAAAERELLWYENSDSGIEGWLQRELEPGEVDAVLSAVLRLRRARLALARGDATNACAWLQRIEELWRHTKAEYQPLRREVGELAHGCAP